MTQLPVGVCWCACYGTGIVSKDVSLRVSASLIRENFSIGVKGRYVDQQ